MKLFAKNVDTKADHLGAGGRLVAVEGFDLMLETFAGWIIGASMMVLFLHFTGRLTPRQPETYTGSPNRISVEIAGNNNGPKLDPFFARKLEEVLPGSTERLT